MMNGQIEEMAEVLENAKIDARATIGSMNNGFGVWYAQALYNAGYRKHSEWISVEDRLPKEDKNVLVITSYGFYKIAKWNSYNNGTTVIWETNDDYGASAITHWMPLPEPPKGGG